MDMGKEYEELKIGQLFRWHCQGGECETDVDDIGVLTSKDYHNREINILWSSDGKMDNARPWRRTKSEKVNIKVIF